MASALGAALKKMPAVRIHKSSLQLAAERAHCLRQTLKLEKGLCKLQTRLEVEISLHKSGLASLILMCKTAWTEYNSRSAASTKSSPAHAKHQ